MDQNLKPEWFDPGPDLVTTLRPNWYEIHHFKLLFEKMIVFTIDFAPAMLVYDLRVHFIYG